MVGSRPGGRLSTTNQPRSSSDLAAVDRPAPDMPVMMTMSGWSSAILAFPTLVGFQGSRDRGGEPGPDPLHGGDLLHVRGAELAHRAEVLEQRGAPGRTETWHVVQGARGGRLAALLPVVG